MFKRLFGEHGAKNVITLFHKPSSTPSTRILTLLKQQSATSSATATEDQASSHSKQSDGPGAEFDLDVTEQLPTGDQLKTILEYVGPQGIGSIVKGATNEAEAVRLLKDKPDSFVRPLVVDWHQGKVVAEENESQILALLKELPHKKA